MSFIQEMVRHTTKYFETIVNGIVSLCFLLAGFLFVYSKEWYFYVLIMYADT